MRTDLYSTAYPSHGANATLRDNLSGHQQTTFGRIAQLLMGYHSLPSPTASMINMQVSDISVLSGLDY